MADIFDEVAPEQKGDIFDEVAPDGPPSAAKMLGRGVGAHLLGARMQPG